MTAPSALTTAEGHFTRRLPWDSYRRADARTCLNERDDSRCLRTPWELTAGNPRVFEPGYWISRVGSRSPDSSPLQSGQESPGTWRITASYWTRLRTLRAIARGSDGRT